MMAYARLYECRRLMLLYPSVPGTGTGEVRRFGDHGGREMIAVGRVDVAQATAGVVAPLDALIKALVPGETCAILPFD